MKLKRILLIIGITPCTVWISETEQLILSTIGDIKQPLSKQFSPKANLPFVTDEYRNLLLASEQADDTPSYSLAEALAKQDLFVNSL